MTNKKILFISINNINNPKTGGEYVYNKMASSLIKKGYKVINISVPERLEKIKNKKRKLLIIPIIYITLILFSIIKRIQNKDIIITSCSPAFPVFGHIVYHQPKASIKTNQYKELNFYEKIGMIIHGKERLSPLWLLAKKSHRIHISNSYFTKNLIKDIYNIESKVIYPPINIKKFLEVNIRQKREQSIIVVRPRAITGIKLLPKIMKIIPKKIPIYIIGKIDKTGKAVIAKLKKEDFKIQYLGYVKENIKLRLFAKCSHYLHLSLNEPFGITVIECMASGCIPIAPKSGGIPEYLPKELLYESYKQAGKMIKNKVYINNYYIKNKIRKIAYRFKEEKFTKKIREIIKSAL